MQHHTNVTWTWSVPYFARLLKKAGTKLFLKYVFLSPIIYSATYIVSKVRGNSLMILSTSLEFSKLEFYHILELTTRLKRHLFILSFWAFLKKLIVSENVLCGMVSGVSSCEQLWWVGCGGRRAVLRGMRAPVFSQYEQPSPHSSHCASFPVRFCESQSTKKKIKQVKH
jgi:hypothetical protein